MTRQVNTEEETVERRFKNFPHRAGFESGQICRLGLQFTPNSLKLSTLTTVVG